MTSSTLAMVIFIAICLAAWGVLELVLWLFKRWIKRLVDDAVYAAVLEKLEGITSGDNM